jgi:integrase
VVGEPNGQRRQRFDVEFYGVWRFAEMVAAAGLPKSCSPHGIGKFAASDLALSGATTKETASVTGHRTLTEIERYTDAADRERLAISAMQKRNKIV